MSKVTLNSVADITQSSTAQTTINTNFATVQTAFDNTLSRDGTSPNTMGAALDMNSFNILNLPSPATVNSPARLVDVVTNPTITVPPTGTSGSTVPFLNGNNTWTGRNIVNYTPVYDIGFGALSVATLYPNPAITVGAGLNYADIRFTLASGASPTHTVGAGSISCNICCSPIMGVGSDPTSALYASIMNATNAGPGTVKGIHGGVFGSGSSTGPLVCFNGQIQPVATQGNTCAFFSSLTSTGVNNKALGFQIESANADQYLFAMGNVVAALPIGTDYIRWWQHASSAAGANFLNLLASDGSTTLFKVTKAGVMTSTGQGSPGFSVDVGGSVSCGNFLAAGSILSSGSAGLGYTTGAGGTVTQATSKATGVTLNKLNGQITMNAASLAAVTTVSFVLTNSTIGANDNIITNHVSGGTVGSYAFNTQCANGSVTFNVRNPTAGALAEAIVINYTVIKGSIT